jgi:hypothetical protein
MVVSPITLCLIQIVTVVLSATYIKEILWLLQTWALDRETCLVGDDGWSLRPSQICRLLSVSSYPCLCS